MLIRHDTDLYDLTSKSRGRTEVIHTTSNHLFWATCRQVDPGRQTPPGRTPQARQRHDGSRRRRHHPQDPRADWSPWAL